MENQDKLYEQFKEAAGKAEQKDFARMESVWNRVEEKLDNKKQRRIAAWWKYTSMAAVFLLFMGIGFFMLTNEKNNPVVAPNVTPENKITTIDTQKVKETFDPVKAVEEKEAVVSNESRTVEATSLATDAVTASEPEQASGDLDKGYESSEDDESFKEKRNLQSSKISKKVITGVITDFQGLPVPGATVFVEGTRTGVTTDFDGKYTIDAKEGEKIVASYIGLQTQTVTLGKRKDTVDIQLAEDTSALQEVVVQGYFSTKKAESYASVTTVTSKTIEGRPSRAERKKAKKEAEMDAKSNSAVGAEISSQGYLAAPTATSPTYTFASQRNAPHPAVSVTSKTIEGKPNANFIQTLQGQVPGLNISTGSGQPGANSTVVLRGYGSVNGTVEPLYVIDGVPLSAENFKSIDPKDIESISVLKDAGATSIYGNRGANGVIIVKTKKPLTEKEKRKLQRLNKKLEKQKKQDSTYVPFTKIIERRPIEVNQEEYESFAENQFENPATTPLSTFSIDVDNASYTNIRRFLNNGQSVPKDAVRVEEMINFFKYQYPQPVNNEPFSINTEYSDAPWNPQHKLLRIGLQGKIIQDDNLPASNFVFLIDVSGSMNEQNKLPLLKESLKLLVNQMRKKDRIAIVVYAGAAGLVLPSTSGDEKEKIFAALDNLSAGGSTAGGAGIELAYKTAEGNFAKNGNNRVILATDGDFNVGASSDSDMQTLIENKRKSGVFLTCLGYGMGNYKDSKMEVLADKGNGNYAYIDNMQEADRYLNKEFKGSMYAIAKDVKIQIEFNPKHVQSYRLIGYENRKLRDEDFTNDAIDAGELGSGHTVTALYEIIPIGIKSDYFNAAPELKYSQPTGSTNQYNDELATIKFRSKKPNEDKSTEIVKIIPNNPMPLQSTSRDFKFSAAVAWFGLKLRDSKLVPNKKTDDIKALAKQGLQNDPDGYRAEFVRLVDMVK